VGFHTELTGRENVFLSGAILGMPKAEIQRKFDEIVAFAELERFIDTSVKRYSSGMQVRLGFAVAAHLEPDILILDELLAVGDAAFQRSCIAKLSELAQSGRAVLFASHYMTALSNFCTRAYRLDRGTIVDSGSASGVIKRYLDQGRPNQQDLSHLPRHRPDFQVLLHTVRVCQDGETVLTFTTGGPFGLEVECRADPEAHPLLGLGFRISSNSGTYIFGSDAGEYGALHPNRSGRVLFRARLDHLVLSPGTYTVSLFLGNGRYILDAVENAASFDVVWAPRPDIPFPPNEWPPVFLPVCWESQELSEPGEDR
jgi:lipopolysaccharide transport system ATP-binding protein